MVGAARVSSCDIHKTPPRTKRNGLTRTPMPAPRPYAVDGRTPASPTRTGPCSAGRQRTVSVRSCSCGDEDAGAACAGGVIGVTGRGLSCRGASDGLGEGAGGPGVGLDGGAASGAGGVEVLDEDDGELPDAEADGGVSVAPGAAGEAAPSDLASPRAKSARMTAAAPARPSHDADSMTRVTSAC
jgi:hypothetical protein